MRISDWSSDVCSSDLTLTNELNPTHTNAYSPTLGPVGPGVDEPHEGLIRFRRGQHRLPAAGEAVRLALFTRLSAVQEYLADRHAGIDFQRDLADIGKLEGQATGKLRMDASRRFDHQTVAAQRGFSGDIARQARRQAQPFERHSQQETADRKRQRL